MAAITYATQLRYLVQWFHEWSELQRADFLPVLLEKFASKITLNGLLPSLESLGTDEVRKPSIFECRVKLFKEWVQNWNDSEKEQFLSSIKSIDEDFMIKYEKELNSDVLINNNNNDIKEVIVNGSIEHKEEDVELEDNII